MLRDFDRRNVSALVAEMTNDAFALLVAEVKEESVEHWEAD